MHLKAVQQILGLLLMIFSVSMLPPVFVSAWYQDGAAPAFVSGFLVTILLGLLIWAPVRREKRELRTRDGFLVVAGFWSCSGICGAAPLLFAEAPRLSVTDAVFEAISGLTTTGATVIVGLDRLPPAILYYRAQLRVVRRDGYRGSRRGGAADARRGWRPALPRRDAGRRQGQQAHAAHHRDGQGTLVHLSRAYSRPACLPTGRRA